MADLSSPCRSGATIVVEVVAMSLEVLYSSVYVIVLRSIALLGGTEAGASQSTSRGLPRSKVSVLIDEMSLDNDMRPAIIVASNSANYLPAVAAKPFPPACHCFFAYLGMSSKTTRAASVPLYRCLPMAQLPVNVEIDSRPRYEMV